MLVRTALLFLCLLVLGTEAVVSPMGYHEAAVNYDGFELLRRLKNDGVPENIPDEFDCQSRLLVYNVSLKMQPSRAPMKDVWEALQLTSSCKFPFPSKTAANLAQQAVGTGGASLSPADYRVFVDHRGGDDGSERPESEDTPLRSVNEALSRVREWRSRHGKTSRGAFSASHLHASIVLRGGIHYLNETIMISVEDSSTSIESYPNETATLSGGVPLTLTWQAYNTSGGDQMVVETGQNNIYSQVNNPGDSTPTIHYMGVTTSANECEDSCKRNGSTPCYSWIWHGDSLGTWKHMCYHRSDHVWAPTSEADMTSGYWVTGPNIYVAEVGPETPEHLAKGLFVQQGTDAPFYRATRARFPNIISQERTQFPNGWVAGGVDWGKPKDLGQPEFITVATPSYDLNPLFDNFRIGRRGPCSIFTPPESYWCADAAKGGGPHMFTSPSGITFDAKTLGHGPYNATRLASSAVLHTWRPAHWSTWMFEFADFNADTMEGSFSRGGFQGARGASTGAEWWLDNVFEELDFPNEYFYNRDEGKLYYFHNGTGAPPEGTLFVAANLKTLVSITGDSRAPVFNFTLQNVALSHAAYTYMDPHGVPSGGDWALQRYGAVFVEGSRNLTVRNCLFHNLDGNALFLSGYVHDSVISNNEFTLIGDSAMAAWGYTDLIDGTNQEQPRRNLVESNYVHEIGLYEKQASCWFQAKSAETRLVKNVCFNGPRAGINFNDGFGGANVLEDNVLFNLCRESSDHAPFNSWDRQPFVTEVATPGVPSVYPAMNNFTHNLVLGNYASSMCFDNDDGSSYYHHSDNYLIYGGHKSNFYGHDKTSTGNYNLYPKVYELTCFRMSFPAVNMTHADGYFNCTCVLQGNKGEHMYSILPQCDVTKPDSLFFKTGGNTIYSPSGKAELTMCGKQMSSDDWLKMNLDPGTSVKVSPDVATIIGWGKTLFGIE